MEIHLSFMIASFQSWMFSSIAGWQTTKAVAYNDTYFVQKSPVWDGLCGTSRLLSAPLGIGWGSSKAGIKLSRGSLPHRSDR